MRIRSKLLIGLLLVAIVPLAIVGSLAYLNAREDLNRAVLAHLASVADLQAARVESALEHYAERRDLLAADPLIRLLAAAYGVDEDPARMEQLRRVLDDALTSNPTMVSASYVDTSGVLLASTDSLATSIDPTYLEWLVDSVAVDIVAGAAATVELAGAAPVAIRDETRGYLLVRHDARDLLAVLSDFTGIGLTGEILLAKRDDGGALLVAPTRHDPSASFTRRIPATESAAPMTHALSGASGTVFGAVDYRGEPVLASVRHLADPDWGLVVKIDEQEAYAPLIALGGRMAALSLLVFGLILVAASWGSQLLATPIQNLTEAADRISRGDRSARAEVEGADEIGRLAESFNRMADHLVEANQRLESRVAQRTAALERSQLRIRAMVEDVEDYAIILLDAGGAIASWNRGAALSTGYEVDEALGQSFSRLFPPDSPRGRTAASDLARATTDGSTRFDDWMTRKDGGRFWASVAVTVLRRGEQLQGYSVVARDMTFRLQAEDRRRRFFELSTELLCIATTEGYFVELNPTWGTVLGWTIEDLKAKPFLDFVHPDDREATEAEAASLAGGGTSAHFENRYRTSDGDYRWLSWNARLSPDGRQIFAAARDVTAEHEVKQELRRARETAEAAAASKANFLANMSHEIRTPMNAIIGLTSLLADTELDAQQSEYIGTISSSGDHLLSVINDILDFSKIEAGMLQLDEQPTAVRRLVEEALDLVAGTAAQKEIEIGYMMSEEVPAGARLDEGRVRQVLVNLLSNAVKFTSEGHVVVRVGSIEIGDGKQVLSFAVADTGVGIAADSLKRIFRPFEQEDVSSTRRFGGTGLGLAITKQLCELMGGDLRAESELGRGSTFVATMACEVTDPPESVVEPWRTSEIDLTGLRVLIVDDTPVNRLILREQVESWGMQAILCDSAKGAISLAREGEHWDVALLDHQMPDMDGIELVRKLTELMETPPPVIIATSMGPSPELDHPSVHGVITKPLKPSRVFDQLAQVLYGRVEADRRVVKPNFDPTFADSHPMKILLAEDNRVNQLVATKVLQQLGYDPVVVEDGTEVLDFLEANRVDLILMDIQMPTMDGLEATRLLRERFDADRQPRVVAMTAHAGSDFRDQCLAAGMDDYVSKPVVPQELASALIRASEAIRAL